MADRQGHLRARGRPPPLCPPPSGWSIFEREGTDGRFLGSSGSLSQGGCIGLVAVISLGCGGPDKSTRSV